MKRFIAFFLAKPVLCLMLVLSGCFLGLIALAHLPVGLMPNLASPGITIVTRYPGVSAEKIHQMITIPVERSVSDLGNIEEILSVSSEGESKVNLLFSNDADIKIKMVEASERVDLVSTRFPRDVNSPYIVQYDPSDRPVFVVSFASSKMDLRTLREHVDRRIKLLFERVDGVSEVFVGGGLEREIEVAVDPGKLVTSGTAVSAVQSAIADSNTFAPGGRVVRPREMSLYTDARVKSVDQLARLPIAGEKGTVILSSVARVSDSFREPDSISRTNGEERVTIYVQKSGKANTLSLTTACEQIVAGLKDRDITTSVIHNQGEHIRKAIRRVAFECMLGGLIALAVLQVFLQKRAISLLIGGAIPACILSTFFLMFLLGIDLNVMTLSGLALGAGMLVDNSVVVCESIQRRSEAGASAREAVLDGTSVVFPEIVSSTLCTIVVFLPLLFTEPDTRRLYSGLALTVSMSLVLSLVFAVTVLPGFMLAAARSWQHSEPRLQAGVSAKVGRSAVQFHRQTMLRVFRDYRISLGLPALLLLAAPVLFRLSRKEFVDPVDGGQIEATADLKSGTHLDRTAEIIRDAESVIRKSPLVSEISTKIEKSHATFHIRLRDTGSKTSEEIIEELRKLTDHSEDAFIYYNASSENESAQDLNLDFLGDDPAVLKGAAKEAAGLIQGHVEGVSQVVLRFREPRTDLLVYPERSKTATTGLSSAALGSTLRTLISGSIATKFYDGEREVDVRVRSIPGAIAVTDDVEQLLLTGENGATPLASLTQIRVGEGETHIYRKNKRTTATITIRSLGRSLDAVAADVEQTLSRMNLPPNTVYAFGKEYKKRIENQNQMLIAVGVSILAVYLLLGALFESFTRPFLILLTVPLSIAGVLIVFTVMRTPLSMSVYIGMIMLSGIVVSNSILVVSTIHRAVRSATRSASHSMIRPILRAARERLRPVLITTGASVTGMLPMALDSSPGAAIWRPLALTVSSGLAFSLTVSLLIVPFACWLYYRRNPEVAP